MIITSIFSVAHITNNHKLSGLKQHKLLLEFWRLEFKMNISGLKIKGFTSGGNRGESVYSSFPTFRGHQWCLHLVFFLPL